MRTSLIISLVVLGIILGGGMLEEQATQKVSERYISAAEELRIMAETADWPRAADTVGAYMEDWRALTSWLQILINHDDIDDVTLALERLQANIDAQDQESCYEACAELRENARHIFHRDAFTLGNVL